MKEETSKEKTHELQKDKKRKLNFNKERLRIAYRTLQILINFTILGTTTSISQIRNIVSPKIDFSNNQIGTMSFTTFWTTDFEFAGSSMKDLTMRIVFPFAIMDPLQIEWIQVSDTCIVSTNMKKTTSSASTVAGDPPGAHFFTLTGANYFKGATYKIMVKIEKTADIPTTLGMTNPVSLAIVSSNEQYFITYAINFNIAKFMITGPAPGDFEFDLTPSYDDPNIAVFTRDFYGMADVRVYSGEVARILVKLDNYVFSDDAESTCTTMPDDERNIQALDRNDFYCEFESLDKKGLYFVWKDSKFVPLQTTFRLRFRIRNPNLPGSSNLKIAMMERHSPKIIKFKSITNAFTCGASNFGVTYPKLYVGPNLDTSSDQFPNVTLFTMMNRVSTVVFNSFRLTFKLSIDLPNPNDFYEVKLTIGGSAKTVIPKTFIYHDLPTASGKKNVFTNIDGTTADIVFTNVGALSSRSTYTIGLKVGFYGDETLKFFGSGTIGSMEIIDSSGTTVIKKAPPQGMKTSFQSLTTNVWPVNQNWPTILHSKDATQTDRNDFQNDAGGIWYNQDNWGLAKGENMQLIFKAIIHKDTLNHVERQSYIEIITHNSITAEPASGIYDEAGAVENCAVREHDGDNISAANLAGCLVQKKNQGLFGSEYSRFRMSHKADGFWSPGTGSNGYRSWVWHGVTISKQNSIAMDDTDAGVLDAYINVYEDTYTQDITVNFVQGLKFSYMVNMIVVNRTQFGDTKIDFLNYLRATQSHEVLTGEGVPTFLRLGGLLNNIDTFESKKVVLFFSTFTPHVKDLDNPNEIGCSTSAFATVKCYYYKGLKTANCNAGLNCNNYFMQDRIEILFSSTIISVATIHEINVMIPILIPEDANETYEISIGTARNHFGTLSAYPQMLSWSNLVELKKPSSRPTKISSTKISAANLAGNAYINYFAQPSTSTNTPTLGEYYSDKFDVQCNNNDCKITSGTEEFYGFTFCAEWDFMKASTFNVDNTRSEAHKLCSYNIHYQYDNGGVNTDKYCVFCPMYSSGTANGKAQFTDFFVDSKYGKKWPAGTFSAITGTINKEGLLKFADLSEIPDSKIQMASSTIKDIEAIPGEFPYDDTQGVGSARSLKVIFKFTLSNPIPENGWLVISTLSTSLSFTLKKDPSPFCYIGTSFEKYPCIVDTIDAQKLEIQLAQEIPAAPIELTLYGINSVKRFSEVEFRTYTPSGKVDLYMIDVFSARLEMNFFQANDTTGDLKVNVMKAENLTLKETNQAYRTVLELGIELDNEKRFYENDRLVVNLRSAGYDTITTAPSPPAKSVYCEIIDTDTKQLITSFKSCNADDLTNIEITAIEDTDYNRFTLRISSFENPIAPTDNPTAKVVFVDDLSYINQEIDATLEPTWPTLVVSTAIPTLTVTKFISYIGLRTQISINMATFSTRIEYESRVYVNFPYEYGPKLGSNPVSCYLKKGGAYEKLYCWFYEERTLVISGFKTTYNAGSAFTIDIFGVEQPEIDTTERFFIAVDSDDDSTVVDESSATTHIAAVPVGSIQLLEVVRSEYSHSFIRATNNVLVEINSPILIPAGWVIYVYFDYLDFEYDNFVGDGSCIIQETEVSANKANPVCQREGNRFKITVATDLVVGVTYSIMVHQIPTPDFYLCNAKKPDLYIIDDLGVLQLISTDFFQNTELTSFKKDSDLVYLDFQGLTRNQPVEFIKGVYNRIEVKREDRQRFNDDFTFTLLDDENGIFAQYDSSLYVLYDSMLGLESYPIFISATQNTFTNIIPIKMGLQARFQNKYFSIFPSLRAQFVTRKAYLRVPSLNVYGPMGSVPVFIEVDEIPISEITFTITFETGPLDAPVASDLSASPATISLSKDAQLANITIRKATDITAGTTETHRMKITPSGTTGYGETVTDVTVYPSSDASGTSTEVVFSITDTLDYGFVLDIVAPKPIFFYHISFPKNLYRLFSLEYLKDAYLKRKLTDQFYQIGYTAVQTPNSFNIEMLNGRLKGNNDYKTLIYYEDLSGNKGTTTIEYKTRDTAGGFGYLNITFVSAVKNEDKPDLMCKLAQLFSYPLEK